MITEKVMAVGIMVFGIVMVLLRRRFARAASVSKRELVGGRGEGTRYESAQRIVFTIFGAAFIVGGLYFLLR